MALIALKPQAIAAAVLNDVGPEVAPEGLARIAAYTGKSVSISNWDDAAEYARNINEAAFPHYDQSDWEAFARRIFREDEHGVPALAYDPDISAPIRAAGSGALVPDLWPLYRVLTERPTLIVRGGTSDLLSTTIAGRMITEGKVESTQGTEVAVQADTLCIHGDQPGALVFARAICAGLQQAGIGICTIPQGSAGV